jgi:hypothetical protein
MIKTEQTLDRLALAAGAIVRDFEASQKTLPRAHIKIVADETASGLDAEMLQVTLLAPIEDEAPKRQAVTARGALFQALLAAGDIGELVGTEYQDQDALRERHKRIEGCIHSIIKFIEQAHGLDRDAVGGAYYAYRSYVPEIWRDGARARA